MSPDTPTTRDCPYGGIGNDVNPYPDDPNNPEYPGIPDIIIPDTIHCDCQIINALPPNPQPIIDVDVNIDIANEVDITTGPLEIDDGDITIDLTQDTPIVDPDNPYPSELNDVRIMSMRPAVLYSSKRSCIVDIKYMARKIVQLMPAPDKAIRGIRCDWPHINTDIEIDKEVDYRRWFWRYFTYGLNEILNNFVDGRATEGHIGAIWDFMIGETERTEQKICTNLADTNIKYSNVYRGSAQIITTAGHANVGVRGIRQMYKLIANGGGASGPVEGLPNRVNAIGETFAIHDIAYQIQLPYVESGMQNEFFELLLRSGVLIIERFVDVRGKLFTKEEWIWAVQEFNNNQNWLPLEELLWERLIEVPLNRCFVPYGSTEEKALDPGSFKLDYQEQNWAFVDAPAKMRVDQLAPTRNFGFQLPRPLFMSAGSVWRVRTLFDPLFLLRVGEYFTTPAAQTALNNGLAATMDAFRSQVQLGGTKVLFTWQRGEAEES